MKIRPVILCGGSGTRLWAEKTKSKAKQFIDFGGWCLFEKTLSRLKNPIYDYPIISTNLKYLKEVKKYLKKRKVKKFKIILEPFKKNTAPAILSSALIRDIPNKQPLVFFSADHLIEKFHHFNYAIKKNLNHLNENNIFVFGIKPMSPSSEYGYFLLNSKTKNKKILRFIEKPSTIRAKKIIKQNGYWNSGIFFLTKESLINNFKKEQPNILKNAFKAVLKSKYKNNTYFLNKNFFKKTKSISFDYAILEKCKKIYGIKLNIPWSDLGSWKEILKMYNKKKSKYFKKENVFHRPWGKYTNLYKGKGFLIKELYIKSKGCLSLQKHFHRSEHWFISEGKPTITIGKKILYKNKNDTIFIPKGSIHRIENKNKKPVKIIEAQLGFILKESDIIRYQDVYGRIK